MDDTEKKKLKSAAKLLKKQAKAQTKAKSSPTSGQQVVSEKQTPPSGAIRFAEAVRGILFMIFAVSLIIAVILSQSGYIITTSDIINTLIGHITGKIILSVISAAFFIYGLKSLRAIK